MEETELADQPDFAWPLLWDGFGHWRRLAQEVGDV